MIKNLVIVESPAKAKTIEKYLGKGFTVRSSYGHIRDLRKGDDAVDIKNGYAPVYEIASDKSKLVSELKKMAKEADVVWLATDEDREGEAISWHLYEVLGLNDANTHRIVFNEITKPAILNAIEHPRKIDRHLVDAQQARRVLDRLVGYELSPILWKKVKPSLSAGRVQSVAVRLIVEREREINEFNSESDFRVVGEFSKSGGKVFKAELQERFRQADQASAYLNTVANASFSVVSVEVKPGSRNPAPPFTTSTLQQEASRKLGFPVAKTMSVAQRLYENGHITYMRTDSVNLSKLAIGAAKSEITSQYGEQYSQPRNFSTKSANAQEAHEAIRPTYFEHHSAGADNDERRLYELIWKRAIASQMAPAKLEKTIVDINADKDARILRAEGEVILFDGFLKVYLESRDDEDEEENSGLLPAMKKGDALDLQEMKATQRYSRPPARYTEATLVRKLEELGIGRPSTYAPTISTVQKRGYVIRDNRDGNKRNITEFTLKAGKVSSKVLSETYGSEKAKLFPTDIGIMVTDFLSQHFSDIMDYSFTAKVEKEFDEIAEGMKSWQKMIDGFYKPFHEHVDSTAKVAERVTGERMLGPDPKTGKPVLVRMARYGPVVQIGDKNDEPRYANLRKGQNLESITLEEALALFVLPKDLGEYNGAPMLVGEGRFGPYLKIGDKFISLPKGEDPLEFTHEKAMELIAAQADSAKMPFDLGELDGEKLTVGKGRFGPYIKYKKLFVSIPKGEDPLNITLERGIQLVKDKQAAEDSKVILTFTENPDIQVLNGRYGPYISHGKNNYRIPKDKEPAKLTWADIQAIVGDSASSPAAAKTKPAAKKAASGKPAAKKVAAKKPAAKKTAAKPKKK